MPQLRFNIGVPRAGSAARDAESTRETFRSLRPEAGSAARQAEEERRESQRWFEDNGGTRRATVTSMRMQAQAPPSNLEHAASNAPGPKAIRPVIASALQQGPDLPIVPAPSSETAQSFKSHKAGSDSPEAVSKQISDESTPLQTAAAKFRSLFRSMLPRATSEN